MCRDFRKKIDPLPIPIPATVPHGRVHNPQWEHTRPQSSQRRQIHVTKYIRLHKQAVTLPHGHLTFKQNVLVALIA